MRKSRTCALIFSQSSQSILMKFSLLPQLIGVLKLMLELLLMINIQGEEFHMRDFMKYTFNIGLHRNTCEPICFKPVMMLDTTNLNSMFPV